jgi:hypothetical protein
LVFAQGLVLVEQVVLALTCIPQFCPRELIWGHIAEKSQKTSP